MIGAAAGALLHQGRTWKRLIVSRAALQQARSQMKMAMTMAVRCLSAASMADLRQSRPMLRGIARDLPWKSHHCAPHSSLQLRLLWLHALGRILFLRPIASELEICPAVYASRRSPAAAWAPALGGVARHLPCTSRTCAPHSSLQLLLLWLHALGRALFLYPLAHALEMCCSAPPRRRAAL